MEKMTIHRALSELKLIDARIEKQISEIVPSGVYQAGKLINGYMTEEEFSALAQSKFDSVTDLLSRKTAIKSAIVRANGETFVTVAGKKMTIADAITYKTVVALKKKFAETLKTRHKQAVGNMNTNNEKVNANIQAILEATFGKDNVKVTKEDMEAVRKPYLAANEFHVFDPLKVENTVSGIEDEILAFEAEVDAVLSEINAVTFIEI